MKKQTWKEFITKRSTIFTLSICMTGILLLGGIAAVDKTRDTSEEQTEIGEVAYLEEEDAGNKRDSTVSGSDKEDEADYEEASGSTVEDSGAEDANAVFEQNNSTDQEASDESTSSVNADTDNTTEEEAALSDSDSEEVSSSDILSEQVLLSEGIHFTDEQSLLWPSAGTILIDYSMDKSVYFSTLNQYKYNPALIISSNTGNQVLASAKGIVESIYIDEETGTTLVLNIGNGYKLTYGQLMEPSVAEGDVVEAGELLAYISDPTKYYSTEGSNLYFSMTYNGEPTDPVLYLE